MGSSSSASTTFSFCCVPPESCAAVSPGFGRHPAPGQTHAGVDRAAAGHAAGGAEQREVLGGRQQRSNAVLLRCVPDVRHALDRARRRPDETRADVQQGGLPRAIGPHDGGDLAGSQAQVDAAQGRLAAVAFRHRAQAEHDGADPEVCIRWGSRTEGASKLLRVGGGRPVHLARAAPGVFGFSQSVPGQRAASVPSTPQSARHRINAASHSPSPLMTPHPLCPRGGRKRDENVWR